MWEALFATGLRRGILSGRLTVIFADGHVRHFGPGGLPDVTLRLNHPDLVRRIVLSPEVAVGEAYMAGSMTLDGDDLMGFLTILVRSVVMARSSPSGRWLKAQKAMMRWADFNPADKARANVAHHYDLTDAFYGLFLDAEMQYTCAYFREPGMTLEQAQAAKMAHIGAKLLIRPGMRVLDIGSGFGTLGIYLAREFGAQVVGVTLSEVQLAEARARARAAGLEGQVQFHLQDYRDVGGQFDRVVSVGMMEHVGRPHLATYFRKLRELLANDGVALIHYIARPLQPEPNSRWFQKYIFPGSYCPALSEVSPIVAQSGLTLTDLEVWRGHYDKTLAAWRARFEANLDQVRALYDDSFIRMWRYYLTAAEASFAEGALTIHQLQLTRQQLAVPGTRDYLYNAAVPVAARKAARSA